MSAWTPPVRGHGRPPVRVRWPRRIAGVLATAALFAVALAMALMIMSLTGGSSPETALTPQPAAGGRHHHAKPAAAHHARPAGLTAAQRRQRSAAVAAVRGEGYEPVSVKQFDPRHALRVLVAHRSGDATGPRRAFFFRGADLVGTDSTAPSTGLRLAGSGNEWATLTYGVYATGDGACCPSGGHVKVRFGWSGSSLAPTGGTVPASSQRLASG